MVLKCPFCGLSGLRRKRDATFTYICRNSMPQWKMSQSINVHLMYPAAKGESHRCNNTYTNVLITLLPVKNIHLTEELFSDTQRRIHGIDNSIY